MTNKASEIVGNSADMILKIEALSSRYELEGWCWALRQGIRPVVPGELSALKEAAKRFGCALPMVSHNG